MRLGLLVVLAMLLVGAPARAAVQTVEVPSYDGTKLSGWLHLPDLEPGEKAPTVFLFSAYQGSFKPAAIYSFEVPPIYDAAYGEHFRPWFLPIERLNNAGYAVAVFSTRGTGRSAGCFDYLGKRDERDGSHLVEWIADQPWSDGGVAMFGVSYDAGTAMATAVTAPRALKAIVVSGLLNSLYALSTTPQGAAIPQMSIMQALFPPMLSGLPAAGDETGPAARAYATSLLQRACPDLAAAGIASAGHLAGTDRDAAFYRPRSRDDRLDKVRAAVLIGHGFLDNGSHAYEEDRIWKALKKAPKAMYEGQWGHQWPQRFAETPATKWERMVFAWLDHYLKGEGEEPANRVEFEVAGEDSGRTATAWPPPTAAEQSLWLDGNALALAAGDGMLAFHSRPVALDHFRGLDAGTLPAGEPVCPGDGDRLIFETTPLADDLVIAGNPALRLNFAVDQPGGLIGARLYDLAPGEGCVDGTIAGDPFPFATAAADLRFLTGYRARPYPTRTPATLQLDFWSVARRVPAGHRLLLVLSHPADRFLSPFMPNVTVDEAKSRLQLPVLSG